jgi:hypothetical protein
MPIEFLTLLAFLPAALALNLTPGTDMMFTLGQGVRGGWRAGQAANLGIAFGGMAPHLLPQRIPSSPSFALAPRPETGCAPGQSGRQAMAWAKGRPNCG